MTLEEMTTFAQFFVGTTVCALLLNIVLLAWGWWAFRKMQSQFDELLALFNDRGGKR
jgi:hypothetical protein